MTTTTNQDTPANPLRARFSRKPLNVEELKADLRSPIGIPGEAIYIQQTVTLTAAEYDDFADNLLVSRDWLAGMGGHQPRGPRQVVAVSAPERQSLFVDPSGNDYGRYVGIAH